VRGELERIAPLSPRPGFAGRCACEATAGAGWSSSTRGPCRAAPATRRSAPWASDALAACSTSCRRRWPRLRRRLETAPRRSNTNRRALPSSPTTARRSRPSTASSRATRSGRICSTSTGARWTSRAIRTSG
jgi:hypothetical protein